MAGGSNTGTLRKGEPHASARGERIGTLPTKNFDCLLLDIDTVEAVLYYFFLGLVNPRIALLTNRVYIAVGGGPRDATKVHEFMHQSNRKRTGTDGGIAAF